MISAIFRGVSGGRFGVVSATIVSGNDGILSILKKGSLLPAILILGISPAVIVASTWFNHVIPSIFLSQIANVEHFSQHVGAHY